MLGTEGGVEKPRAAGELPRLAPRHLCVCICMFVIATVNSVFFSGDPKWVFGRNTVCGVSRLHSSDALVV